MAVTAGVVLMLVLVTVITANQVGIEYQNARIKGVKMAAADGKEYLAFRGIPYGESPEGELRFKPPVAKQSLQENEELDATKDGPVCVQIDIITNKLIGQEDCLFLNVYSPGDILTNPAKKYPVMVWIHGGGWQVGFSSSWMYGPGVFMQKEIVFVSINYRLGALGFLSTNDDASPGNYGMLDQVEALRWVKENIDDFGGDPEQVTLFGQSAGSASVYYHMLSPLSQGLFHQAVTMSGTPLCAWAVVNDPTQWTDELAISVNCPVGDNVELVNCLRNINANEIVEATAPLSVIASLPFIPVVDGYFLPSEPVKLLAEGKINSKVPVITGMTKGEGAGFYAIMFRKLMEYSDEFLEKTVQNIFNFPPNHVNLARAIKEKYFDRINLKDKLEVARSIAQFLSDAMESANYQTTEYLINAGIKTYVYSFDYSGKLSIVNVLGFKHRLGVAHGDELIEMFENQLIGKFAADAEISDKMISFLTNFAISGDPNGDLGINWPPVTEDDFPVCHINKPMSVDKLIPDDDDPRFNFWLKVVPEILSSAPSVKEEL